MKSKFLSEKEYEEFLAERRHYFESVPLKDITYDLLSKYGFSDGDSIPGEIEDVIERRAKELSRALDGVCGFETSVVETGHNPHYVAFRMGGDWYTYHDVPLEVKWKIDKIVENLE